jgi:predicted membrane chloride channel (bestrophin family)
MSKPYIVTTLIACLFVYSLMSMETVNVEIKAPTDAEIEELAQLEKLDIERNERDIKFDKLIKQGAYMSGIDANIKIKVEK